MAIPSILEFGVARHPKFRCMFAWGGDLALVGGLNGSAQTTAATVQVGGDPLYLNSDSWFTQANLIDGNRTTIGYDKPISVGLGETGSGFCNGAPINPAFTSYRIFLLFHEDTTFNEIKLYFHPDIYNPIFNSPGQKGGFPKDFVIKTSTLDTTTPASFTNTVETVVGNTNPLHIVRFASTTAKSIMIEISKSHPELRVIRILAMEVFNFVNESANVKDDNFSIVSKRDNVVNKLNPTEWYIEFSNPNYGSALGGRYTPKNTASPIFGKTQADGKGWIRAGTPVEFYGGFLNGAGTLFEEQILAGQVGYDADVAASNGLQMDSLNETITISGQDRTGRLVKLVSPLDILVNSSVDDGLVKLLMYGGVSPAEMDIDTLLTQLSFYVTENSTIWDQVQEIARSYGGVAFFDSAGLFRLKVGIVDRRVFKDTQEEFTQGAFSNTNTQQSPNIGSIAISTKNFSTTLAIPVTHRPGPYESIVQEYGVGGLETLIVIRNASPQALYATMSTVTGVISAWSTVTNIDAQVWTGNIRLVSEGTFLVMITTGKFIRADFTAGFLATPTITTISNAFAVDGSPSAVSNGLVYILSKDDNKLRYSAIGDLITWTEMGTVIPNGSVPGVGWLSGRAEIVNNVFYAFGINGANSAVFLDGFGTSIEKVMTIEDPIAGPNNGSGTVFYDGTCMVGAGKIVGGTITFRFAFIDGNGLLDWNTQTLNVSGLANADGARLAGVRNTGTFAYTYLINDPGDFVRYGISFNGGYGFWALAESGTYFSGHLDGKRMSSWNTLIVESQRPASINFVANQGTLRVTGQESDDAITWVDIPGSAFDLLVGAHVEVPITSTGKRFYRWKAVLTSGGDGVNTYTTNAPFLSLLGIQAAVSPTPSGAPIVLSSSVNLGNFNPQDGNPRLNSSLVTVDNYILDTSVQELIGLIQGQQVASVDNLSILVTTASPVTLTVRINDLTFPYYDSLRQVIGTKYPRFLTLDTTRGLFVAQNEANDLGAGFANSFDGGNITVVYYATSETDFVFRFFAATNSYVVRKIIFTGYVINTRTSFANSSLQLFGTTTNATSIAIYGGRVYDEFSSKYIDSTYLAQKLSDYQVAEGKDSKYYATGVVVPIMFTPNLFTLLTVTNPNSGLVSQSMVIFENTLQGTNWESVLTLEED